MLRMDTNRRVVMLTVVVVLSLGSPLAAAGWEMPARWVSSGDVLKGFTRILTWLGVTPARQAAPQCDQGMGIDPNGVCLKALGSDYGSSIDPNGALFRMTTTTDGGMSIDPNGHH